MGAYRLISPPGEAFRVFTFAGALALVACVGGGCSFSLPSIAPAPEDVTGSIRKIDSRLSSELGQEDWRRAKGALAVALHPQGNGQPVKWDNPETKMAGKIAPAGPPFVEANEVCRKFKATIDPPGASAKIVEGYACKMSAEEWAIKDVRPPRKG